MAAEPGTDTDTEAAEPFVIVGQVSGLFGVKGWLKIFAYTDPRESILQYDPWYLRVADGWHRVSIAEGQRHGKTVIVRLQGCTDRDAAAVWIGHDIAVHREQLPILAADEYYWSDLEGLEVVTTGGVALGKVAHLLETGANDVLVVKGERERLIPYIRPDVVVEVDVAGGVLRVDWDPEF